MDTFSPKCDAEHLEIGTEGTSREEQDNSCFTLADYNALLPLYTTADLESDEAQELLMNYISYLHEVVEKFEQGTCLKHHVLLSVCWLIFYPLYRASWTES